MKEVKNFLRATKEDLGFYLRIRKAARESLMRGADVGFPIYKNEKGVFLGELQKEDVFWHWSNSRYMEGIVHVKTDKIISPSMEDLFFFHGKLEGLRWAIIGKADPKRIRLMVIEHETGISMNQINRMGQFTQQKEVNRYLEKLGFKLQMAQI